MRKQLMQVITALAVIAGAPAASGAEPPADGDGSREYGVVGDIYPEQRQVVINDTAMEVSPGLTVRNANGTAAVGISALRKGMIVSFPLGETPIRELREHRSLGELEGNR